MVNITKEDLYNALYIATSTTYLIAIKKATPTGKSGLLADSWDLEVSDRGIILYNEGGDIIKWLEEGTKPHIIKPKTSKGLAFYSKKLGENPVTKDGAWIFKSVKHPGIKARRFIQNLMEDKKLQKDWELKFDERMTHLIKTKFKLK